MILTMISFFLLVVIRKKFNYNTFNQPLNFISAIYNGKISLKEAEFKERNLEYKKQKIYNLTIDQKMKKKKKKYIKY